MRLELATENEFLKERYSETALNFNSDSGFDLFCPETVTVPARAVSFMLDLQVKGCVWIPINRSYAKEWNDEIDDVDGPMKLTSFQKCFRPYLIFPRSSMGAKTPLRLANSIGLIDADYRGNLKLCLDNLSDKPFVVEQGMRLVQLVQFTGRPFKTFQLVDSLNETERGEGGFGSTGK